MNLPWLVKRGKSFPDFAGKTVTVYGRFPQFGGGIYEHVRFARIGFNDFLVGRMVSQVQTPGDHWSGVETWTAVGDIGKLLIFDSPDAARKTFASEVRASGPSGTQPNEPIVEG